MELCDCCLKDILNEYKKKESRITNEFNYKNIITIKCDIEKNE